MSPSNWGFVTPVVVPVIFFFHARLNTETHGYFSNFDSPNSSVPKKTGRLGCAVPDSSQSITHLGFPNTVHRYSKYTPLAAYGFGVGDLEKWKR
jgi:hypothetical protein